MKVGRLKSILEKFNNDEIITVQELSSNAYYLKIGDCAIIIENDFETKEQK